MKNVFFWISLIGLFLAACEPEFIPTPPPTRTKESSSPVPVSFPTSPPIPTSIPLATHLPADLDSAREAAVTSLSSTLDLPPDQIELVTAQAVIWPNSCMGVQRGGVLCINKQVPGFVIVLGANGKQYEFHTNQDGSLIVPAGGAQASGVARDAVKKHLALMLGIDANQITVVSDTEVEWPDSCLGVAQPGIMCAMMVTPGYLILLRANDLEYEYHTNMDGSEIQPATLALTWSQDGGIAGLCDSLNIYLSGEATVNNCKGDARNGNLLPDEVKQLDTWVTHFGRTNLDASDPAGVSDRMTRQLSLFGKGKTQPSDPDQQALFTWAQDLYHRVYK
jgi:hypothetical protein